MCKVGCGPWLPAMMERATKSGAAEVVQMGLHNQGNLKWVFSVKPSKTLTAVA